MSRAQFTWYSDALGKPVVANVLLPDSGDAPYPVLYLLHGLCGGADDWLCHTRLEWYMRQYPMAVVMPDGFRGFYTRHHEGPDHGRYIAQELPAVIERHFNVRRDRGGRAIAGLSMGGYGAMRVAMTQPDRYACVAAHSAPMTIGTWPERVDVLDQAELGRIFGPAPVGSEHDLMHLAAGLATVQERPAIRIDSGTEDPIPLQQSREMHDHLLRLGIEHDYLEQPGQHNWDYWDRQIAEALPWHASQLGLTRS